MAFVVFDTNVLVAAALTPAGGAGKSFERALRHFEIAMTRETFGELRSVLGRSGIRRYVSAAGSRKFLAALRRDAAFFAVKGGGPISRDASDDKFVHLALAVRAAFLVTGDADLLDLGAWLGVDIVSPRDFLRRERLVRRGRRHAGGARLPLPPGRGIG